LKLRCKVPEVLDNKEQEAIFQSALRIISEVPLVADGTEEFNQALVEFGCRIEEKKVFFPKHVINRVLDRIAEAKRKNNPQSEELPDKITPYVSGQGSLIADTATDEVRPAATADLADLARLIDALGPDVGWCHPALIPADKPIRTREIHAFATICLNHSKPSRVSPYSAQALKYMYEILKVCLGSDEKVRQNWFLIGHKIWINTPFMLGRESIEGAMLSRKLLGHKLNFTMNRTRTLICSE
jgi:trimethylamine:corrinoid methyltransferase-like protein